MIPVLLWASLSVRIRCPACVRCITRPSRYEPFRTGSSPALSLRGVGFAIALEQAITHDDRRPAPICEHVVILHEGGCHHKRRHVREEFIRLQLQDAPSRF